MNRKTAAGSLLAFTLLAAIVQPSCAPEPDTNCPDCGPCGFAGPYASDFLGVPTAGADPEGVPTVELQRFEEGECKGASGARFWVRFENGAVSVAPAPSGVELDPEPATESVKGAQYNFQEAGVSVSIDVNLDDVVVMFSTDTASVKATCAVDAESVACPTESLQ